MFNIITTLIMVSFGITVGTPLSLTFALVALASGVDNHINPMED